MGNGNSSTKFSVSQLSTSLQSAFLDLLFWQDYDLYGQTSEIKDGKSNFNANFIDTYGGLNHLLLVRFQDFFSLRTVISDCC